jgi:hypothetical protein
VCKAPGATIAPPSFMSYLAFSLPMLSTGSGFFLPTRENSARAYFNYQPPCRPIVRLPPEDVACRRSRLLVSALPWCCSPTSSTPGTDIVFVSEKALRTGLSGGG